MELYENCDDDQKSIKNINFTNQKQHLDTNKSILLLFN